MIKFKFARWGSFVVHNLTIRIGFPVSKVLLTDFDQRNISIWTYYYSKHVVKVNIRDQNCLVQEGDSLPKSRQTDHFPIG